MSDPACPDTHYYEPAAGHNLVRDPLKAILGPRPIGWISTKSKHGVPNLAPYSFFSMLSDAPPTIGFSSMGWKDSLQNVQDRGEFVYNLATRPLAQAVNRSSAAWPADVDEFAMVNLPMAPSRLVDCPRVAESPASLECKLIEIVRMKNAGGEATDSWLTIGEVVAVHIANAYLRNGLFVTGSAQIIQRGGYSADYFEVLPEGLFTMRRPAEP